MTKKIELISNNPHLPKGMIIEVEEKEVDKLIKTGMYKHVKKPVIKNKTYKKIKQVKEKDE